MLFTAACWDALTEARKFARHRAKRLDAARRKREASSAKRILPVYDLDTEEGLLAFADLMAGDA